MKRIVNALDKLNWGKRACALSVLYATAISLPAQTFTTLYSFDGGDGGDPVGALVQAIDGNLYGTTGSGGANGQGTVFKISPSGALTTIHNFCSQSGCPDGEGPSAGLLLATDGNLYGTTGHGGANQGGTVFRISQSGALTAIYSFCYQSVCADGTGPAGGLVQANDGDFYGTTGAGGSNGQGTVFKITPGGALTTLASFSRHTGCHDGVAPSAALVQADNGNFYGTTDGGGDNCLGSVFEITPGGTLTTLHSFCAQSGCPDGAGPYGGLAQSTDGALYGTTVTGGSNHVGTFFKVTTNGTLTTLYSFCSGACADGYYPYSGLVLASDGDFYGTTQRGGPDGYGTAFKITPGGTLTTLYRLGSQSGAGEYPVAALVQDTNGAFYGTTPYGAADNDGTVFGFSAGLRPFVKTLPHYGNVGTAITILGTDLTGTTSVSFNGTPAAFNIVSATEITTTVPAATTSGSVQVTTPGGVLLSGGPFLVVP